jgi:hypothetical protein
VLPVAGGYEVPRHKITQSDSPNWRTPQWLRLAVQAECPLVLDVAADDTPGCAVAPRWLGPGSGILEDALCGVPWARVAISIVEEAAQAIDVQVANPALAAAIWCNPPYCNGNKKLGKPAFPIEPWVEAGAIAGRTIPTVMLLPHAHQTQWWRRLVEAPDPTLRAAEVRPFPFRIAFDPPPDYEGTPTGSNVNHALVIWHPKTRHFQEPWTPHRVQYDPRSPALPGHRASRQDRTARGR